MPGIQQISNGISFLSVEDLIGMAINADEMAGMQHLEEFIKIYDEKLTKVVKSSLDESNEEVMHLVNISQDN